MNNQFKEINLSSNEEKVIVYEFEEGVDETIIHLSENSHLIYITMDLGNTLEFINKVKANLKKDANLEVYNIITSDKSSKINQTIYLNEINAKVEIMNLLLLTKNAELESMIEIFHQEKSTISSLSNYVIAKDEAITFLNNNAKIEKNCSKSIAHQQTKGLTLSENAKIKALPNLYIDEYDVIANHACSIGSINKEDLFYLMSRGMSQEEASKIIVMGYVKPILDHIKDESLKAKIDASFAKYLLN